MLAADIIRNDHFLGMKYRAEAHRIQEPAQNA
jgi:hypothetical protein